MIALIAGGGGFIGKNLILYLYELKYTIIVIDNFISSSKTEFNDFITENDVHLTLYDADITTFDFNVFGRVDYIYHLASLASPVFYKKFPLETLNAGYTGTLRLLEYAKKYDARFLFASSSEIYGEAKVSPQPETYYGNVNTFGERSAYDTSKRIGEALCFTYKNDVNVRVARIFNTFGPYMNLHDGRLVTEIVKHTIKDTTMTVYGDGKQTRSLCFIDDTVDMLYKLMSSECSEPINIGNDKESTILVIIQMCNPDLELQFEPLTQNDPLHRRPCLTLNKRVLGQREYLDVETGLKLTMEFFTKRHKKLVE
jgi:nucleoside-diphosphate-sugar epimerase